MGKNVKKLTYEEILNNLKTLTSDDISPFLIFLNEKHYVLTPEDILNLMTEKIIINYLYNLFTKANNNLKKCLNENIDLNLQKLLEVYYNEYLLKDLKEVEVYNQSIKDEDASYINFKHDLLSHEKERELIKKCHEGDKEAQEMLIMNNQRLVAYRVYTNIHKATHLDFDDLVMEGNIGLIKAISRYDLNKNFKLSTYAIPWIDQAINNAIKSTDRTIRKPSYMEERISKIYGIKNNLSNKLNREPTILEIAASSDFTEKQIKEILSLNLNVASLDENITEDEDVKLSDAIASKENIEFDVLSEESYKALTESMRQILTPQEYQILCMRLGIEGYSKRKLLIIGDRLNVTRQRVQQIEAKGLEKLRNNGIIKDFILEKGNEAIIRRKKETENTPLPAKNKIFNLKVEFPGISKATFFSLLSLLPIYDLQLYTSFNGINLKDKNFYNTYDYEKNNYIKLIEYYLKTMVKVYLASAKESERTKLEEVKLKMVYNFLNFRFPETKLKVLQQAVSLLSSADKNLVYEVYGSNLTNKRKTKTSLKEIYPKIIEKLHNPIITEKLNQEVFFKKIGTNDLTKIKNAMLLMSKEEQSQILETYGDNFTKNTNKMSDEKIILKLKEKLRIVDEYAIFADFPNASLYELRLICHYILNSYEQNLIYTQFGSELNYYKRLVLFSENNLHYKNVQNKILTFLTHDFNKISDNYLNQNIISPEAEEIWQIFKSYFTSETDNIANLSNEELLKYYQVIAKIIELDLKYSLKVQKAFLEKVGCDDINSLRDAINHLPKKMQNIIYHVHGFNFNLENDQYSDLNHYKNAIKELTKILKCPGIKKFFPDHDIDELRAINTYFLNEDDHNFLISIFGENLISYNITLTSNEDMQKFNNISRKIKKYLNPDLSDLLTPIYLVELPAYLKKLPLELQALANKIYKDYKVNFKPCCKLNLASADIFKYYQILKMLIEDSKVKRIAFKKYTLREIFGNDIPLTTFQKLISYLYEPYKNCLLNVHGQELYHQDFNLPTYKFTYISSIIELSKMDFTDLEKNIFLCKSLNNYDLEEIKGLVSQLSLNLQRNIYFKFGPDLTENRKVGKFSDAKYLINIISDELKLSKHKNSSLKLTLKSF